MFYSAKESILNKTYKLIDAQGWDIEVYKRSSSKLYLEVIPLRDNALYMPFKYESIKLTIK